MSFAELCKSYVPNNSDKKDLTLYSKLKTFVTKRNKPARLREALRERELQSEEERQGRMALSLQPSRILKLNSPQGAIERLNIVKKLVNNIKNNMNKGENYTIISEKLLEAMSKAQQSLMEFEGIRTNAEEKSENVGYTEFSRNYYTKLDTKAEELSKEASDIYSELVKLRKQLAKQREQSEEERISKELKPLPKQTGKQKEIEEKQYLQFLMGKVEEDGFTTEMKEQLLSLFEKYPDIGRKYYKDLSGKFGKLTFTNAMSDLFAHLSEKYPELSRPLFNSSRAARIRYGIAGIGKRGGGKTRKRKNH